MNNILKIVLQLNISGSIFFIIFSLISFFSKNIFSAKWNFLVLKLNMIFFIFPIVSIYDYFIKKSSKVYLNSFNIVFNKIGNINNSLWIFKVLFIVWIVGVVVFIVWNIYCYYRFTTYIMSNSYEDKRFDDILYRYKLKLNIKSNIAIIKSNSVKSPVVIGIVNPKIIFPINIEYDNKLEPVINHELVHLKRRDLLTKFIQRLITAINWFNPIIYMFNNNMEKWCEISCDEIVAEDLSYDERKEYGNMILNVIENVSLTPSSLCLYLCNDKKYIKRRLVMMLNSEKSSRIKNIFSGLLVGGLVLGSTVISVSAKTSNNNSNNINLSGKSYEEAISIIKDSGLDFISEEFISQSMMEENEIGAIVVINVETGEVLEHISYSKNE